ncbi:hypothetical protein PINS_up003742 [Pythium insidiosum]|nr:hypothetical protein PINS_up003742 [Pythium insidiosum]
MGDRTGISLLVRNVSRRLRPEDIRKEFEKFGEVRDVYIPKDYYTREAKGFAFVEFKNEREADDARHNLDGVRMDGREIRVVFAQEKRKSSDQMRDRERTQKNRSRSRSGSRAPVALALPHQVPLGLAWSFAGGPWWRLERPFALALASSLPPTLAGASLSAWLPAALACPQPCSLPGSPLPSSSFAGSSLARPFDVALALSGALEGPLVLASPR